MIKIPNININPIYLNYQFAAFSDSFAVSMSANSGCRVIDGAVEICRSLLNLGFLTRGGITVGDLHHIDNVIFGPALIDAVRIEKEAYYPRLICSPKLVEHLKKVHGECAHIIVDHLGRRIANLFVIGAASETSQPLNPRVIFGITAIEGIIEERIHRLLKIDRTNRKRNGAICVIYYQKCLIVNNDY